MQRWRLSTACFPAPSLRQIRRKGRTLRWAEDIRTKLIKLLYTELLLLVLQPKRPLASVLTLPALGASPVRMPVIPRAPYISTPPAHSYIPTGELLQKTAFTHISISNMHKYFEPGPRILVSNGKSDNIKIGTMVSNLFIQKSFISVQVLQPFVQL